jgi:hypothetical protein
LFHKLHSRVGHPRDTSRALGEDTVQISRIGGDVRISLLQRFETRHDCFNDILFQIAVTHTGEVGPHEFIRPSAESLVDGKKIANPGPHGFKVNCGI